MIKKIGSNKYGVVEYAISSVEDIADLPLGVAIGSTAVLINKDGIRTFALGEGEWVEYIDAERYDKNKLAQDLLFCGFGNDGEKYDDLDDRLMVEFDEINERVNVGNYLGYNGCRVKADYSLEGLQRGVMLEGRTLQNICIGEGNFHGYYEDTGEYYHATNNKQPLSFNLKPNTTYTRIMHNCEFNGDHIYMFDSVNETDGTYKQYPYYLVGSTCVTKFTTGEKGGANEYVFNPENGTAWTSGFSLKIGKLVILEGDYTNTPLEELPFIEGIESVGESELTDEGYKISGKSCGRNLFNFDMANFYSNLVVDKKNLTIQAKDNNYNDIQFWVYLRKGVSYRISIEGHSLNRANCQILEGIQKGFKQDKELNYSLGNNGFTFTHEDGWYTIHIVNVRETRNYLLYAEIGDSSYEPYQESTYSYILDEPLRSLPNGVCDTIDFETGVLTRRVGKFVFKGDETYNIWGIQCVDDTTAFYLKHDLHKQDGEIICNKLPVVNDIRSNTNFECIDTASIYIVRFRILNSNLESQDIIGVKKLLSKWYEEGNPLIVYYELVEPIIHQLDQNTIYSFKDTTHIISDNLITPRITTNILTNSNALISHLKGENLVLTNEVSTLSLRNRETQETNETQDHIIDASLCAVDELYMLYETTQEVEAMSVNEEGSRMVDMYVAMVQRGLKTIDQVPVRYREKVREILAQLED